MQTIIVSDNIRQAEFIQKGFKYENLSSDVITSGETSLFENYLPFYDGIFILTNDSTNIEDLLGQCKILKPSAPIFILCNKLNARLLALKTSGDITMLFVRPFAFRTIASEMRFLIFSQKENKNNDKLVLRDLELDLSKHQLMQKKTVIDLRNKEFALLHFLMMNSGKVLSRTLILENVWDRNANILTNTVDVHISLLRKKIEKTADQKYIHTIPCTGYLLS